MWPLVFLTKEDAEKHFASILEDKKVQKLSNHKEKLVRFGDLFFPVMRRNDVILVKSVIPKWEMGKKDE